MERHIRRNGKRYTVREERSTTTGRWIYVVYTAEGERLFGTRLDGAGIYSRLDVLHAKERERCLDRSALAVVRQGASSVE